MTKMDDSPDLARLYQSCFGELVGCLDHIVGDRATAEDIAQEAGMRLLHWPGHSEEPLRQPKALLFRIAINLARDHLRRLVVRRNAAPELERMASTSGQSADTVAAAREQLERVQQAMQRMPARPREVLLLSRVEGLSHGEIAVRLGITPKTVENHLARALAMLAIQLGDPTDPLAGRDN